MQFASSIKSIRLVHRYLGLFFAPAIIFFAFTGALQTFGLHENSQNSSYVPPRWIVSMAQLHKKQTAQIPPPKNRAQPKKGDEAPAATAKQKTGNNGAKLALKWFVFVMSLALMLTTFLGVMMALRYGGSVRVVWAVVLFGVLFPVAIVLM
ncbi:MAG TPA: hypothetical protein VG844_01930 [Terracidiphilus sp.]|nr:hypothetical protein [Terracidiphilus sp.]